MYGYGSHVGPLGAALAVTKGPVLELGMGFVSTPLMHWACFPLRPLLSIDEDFDWVTRFRQYETTCEEEERPYHHIRHVTDWDCLFNTIGLEWSVVLIDCEIPKHFRETQRYDVRISLVRRLRDIDGILVVHDTEEKCFHEDPSLWDFKFRWTFKPPFGLPWTTLASQTINFLSLMGLEQKE